MDDAAFRTRYGSWAVVAGASQGLGAEYATQLAAHGLNVVLVARQADRLQALSEQLATAYRVQVRVLPIDLAASNAAALIAELTHDLEIGLLIYNAAYSVIGPALDQPLEQHLRELDVNTRTPLELVYRLGQDMRARRRGGLILMSSVGGSFGTAYIANYAATKAYLQILGEGLWDELRAEGVDVLACCAGMILTPTLLASQPKRSRLDSFADMTPDQVARETLKALGHQPSWVPGWRSRWATFFMRRVLPRRSAIHVMGQTVRKMYS